LQKLAKCFLIAKKSFPNTKKHLPEATKCLQKTKNYLPKATKCFVKDEK
tara:strand:+ start:165 stop:311 length:147 start_codon:yes stop_codon:yes gene_type:complete